MKLIHRAPQVWLGYRYESNEHLISWVGLQIVHYPPTFPHVMLLPIDHHASSPICSTFESRLVFTVVLERSGRWSQEQEQSLCL